MSKLREQLSEDRLQQLIADLPWYHTLTLPGGITTSGTYDNAPTLPHYHLPESLKGKKALDVGTSDGFFAFELERRGADSVLAIDVNPYDGTLGSAASPAHEENIARKYQVFADKAAQYPDVVDILGMPGMNNLLVARDLLGSKVEFRNASIYDLSDMGEQFDVVMCGDLIEHLKNPLEALENLVAATGELCVIALSGALTQDTPQTFKARLVHKIARTLKVPLQKVDHKQQVTYLGNTGGGSFFRFHPLAFREALLASGFKQVEIKGEFDLLNRKWNLINHHAIFHCYV